MKNVLVKQAYGIDWLVEGEIFEWDMDKCVLVDICGTEIDYHNDKFNLWDVHHWNVTDDKVLTLFGLEDGHIAVLEVI